MTVEVCARAFRSEGGLDHITDLPSTEADDGTLMTGAEENGNRLALGGISPGPTAPRPTLSENGTAGQLTSTGRVGLDTRASSGSKTAQRACVQ